MSEPKMPGYTCQMIDKLKRQIENAFELSNVREDGDDAASLQAVLSDIYHALSGEAEKLEDIRDANLALRNCAEYWQEKAERLQEEIDDAAQML